MVAVASQCGDGFDSQRGRSQSSDKNVKNPLDKLQKVCYNINVNKTCVGAGTGIQIGLKNQCPNGIGGSIPLSRTNTFLLSFLSFSFLCGSYPMGRNCARAKEIVKKSTFKKGIDF